MKEMIVLAKQYPGRSFLGRSEFVTSCQRAWGAASPEVSLKHTSMGSPFTPFKLDFTPQKEHQSHRAWLSAN